MLPTDTRIILDKTHKIYIIRELSEKTAGEDINGISPSIAHVYLFQTCAFARGFFCG